MFQRLRGLRVQMLLWTILPLAIVLVALTAMGLARHRQAMVQLIADRNRGLTLAEASRLSRQIAQRADALAAMGSAQMPTPESIESLAAPIQALFDGGLALWNIDGDLVAASKTAAAWARPDIFPRLVGATNESQPRYVEVWADDDVQLLIATRMADGQILAGAISVEMLPMSELSSLVETAAPGAVVVLNADGQLIHHHNPHQFALTSADLATLAPPAILHGAGSRQAHIGDAEFLVTYAPIDPPGWMLVSIEDVHASAGMGLETVEVLPLIFLFVAMVALMAVYFGLINVVRPLQELDRRAAQVAWGNYEAIAEPVGGVQEIEDLRATLGEMSQRIRVYQTGMHDYLSAVTQAQEEERARLARELHDDTVQALIALKQRSQMAHKVLGRDPERAGQRLDELDKLIDQELVGLRRLIGDLRPIYLDELGFVPALEILAQQMQTRHGLHVDLARHGEAVRLAPDRELAAYRIVQQGLSNVAAHAHARRVKLAVTFAADGLTLAVTDDGRGFTPPDQPADLARQGHFGLMGMHERAVLYGGRLTIESAPGRGTTIRAWLPFE